MLGGMWIHTVHASAASGLLKRIYDAAVERAGKVYAIVASMSLNPRVLRSSMQLYREIMMGESPLSRQQRELLATAVSRFNECHY
jgi:alkylhydroperoxidase family enzyme